MKGPVFENVREFLAKSPTGTKMIAQQGATSNQQPSLAHLLKPFSN
jgi:hypothetical protein